MIFSLSCLGDDRNGMRILRLGVELVLCSLLAVEGREPKSDGLRFTEGGEGWEE